MSIAIELPVEVEQVLAVRAQALGVSIEAYLIELFTEEAARLESNRPQAPAPEPVRSVAENI